MLLKKLFRTAWRYKSQFISMIIMVTVGIGIFFGFNMEWKSLEVDVNSFLKETNYADFRLYEEDGFSEDDIKNIENINGVDSATRYLSVNVGIEDTKKTLTLNVTEDADMSTLKINEGKAYDEDSDGIWLAGKFANENDIKIGDQMTLTYKGVKIKAKVVALVQSSENMICLADDNQLMPDYSLHGFAYISPKKLEDSLGVDYYSQINIISDLSKGELEDSVKEATGKTFIITDKEAHPSYAGLKSEMEEGQSMGMILPVLFLGIGILTMVTTMHRIAGNEKVQIGTLKALGFRDNKILRHYTSYGFVLGVVGVILGVPLGYFITSLIIDENGMMGTYFDMPNWDLVMPGFCIPVIIGTVVFLTLISYLSVKKMLKGNAAEALRPYTPKKIRHALIEKTRLWQKFSFGTKWNVRDIIRHKSRTAMSLVGIFGCMLLLVGGLGMRDTINDFVGMMGDDAGDYKTKIELSETATNSEATALADEVDGDWQASTAVSYDNENVNLEIYDIKNGHVNFLTEDNEAFELSDDGVYLCLRLKETADIGDEITVSPYGSDKTYRVKVAGYYHAFVNKSIVMTEGYAKDNDIPYHISNIYTTKMSDDLDDIKDRGIVSGIQAKDNIVDSFNSMLEIMNLMVAILVIAAVVLGIVVLYTLGVMSYMERYRELATLKVLGFRDKKIGELLITQNVWLTLIGVLIGLPAGAGVLYFLLQELGREYEFTMSIGWATYAVSIALTFGVSIFVGVVISKKNKKIDMVQALKDVE